MPPTLLLILLLPIATTASEQIVVKITSDFSGEFVENLSGCRAVRRVENLEDYWVFECDAKSEQKTSRYKIYDTAGSSKAGSIDEIVSKINKAFDANRKKRGGDAELEPAAQKQVHTPYSIRAEIPDPFYYRQGHLKNQATGLNAEGAWEDGYTGKGVVIAVVDDGVEANHAELKDNVRLDLSRNMYTTSSDPTPSGRYYHGTACAGLASAKKGNGVCGSGVAPDSEIAGILLLGDGMTDVREAEALSHGCKTGTHVYSNSWGPVDDGKTVGWPGYLVTAAMKECTTNGRNGSGCIYVWAAGNGRNDGDNCAYDGFVNNPYAIAVGAVDEAGVSSYYSEWCSAVFTSAPSSDDRKGVTTCDPSGTNGKTTGNCMTTFGGTSASAPMVAAVVALVLQANPALTWMQVVLGLALSHKRTDAGSSTWVETRAGLWHSVAYGFGIIDARKACKVARLFDRATCELTVAESLASTTDATYGTNSVQAAIAVAEDAIQNRELAFYVCFRIDCGGTGRNNINVAANTPSGTTLRLATSRSGDDSGTGLTKHVQFCTWEAFGEPITGTWTVTLSRRVQTVNNVRLAVSGASISFIAMSENCLTVVEQSKSL